MRILYCRILHTLNHLPSQLLVPISTGQQLERLSQHWSTITNAAASMLRCKCPGVYLPDIYHKTRSLFQTTQRSYYPHYPQPFRHPRMGERSRKTERPDGVGTTSNARRKSDHRPVQRAPPMSPPCQHTHSTRGQGNAHHFWTLTASSNLNKNYPTQNIHVHPLLPLPTHADEVDQLALLKHTHTHTHTQHITNDASRQSVVFISPTPNLDDQCWS